MIRHCIFIYSDYISGKRIALHLESKDSHTILKKYKKILIKLKANYPSAKYGVYTINTLNNGWEYVVEYDQFFSDVQVLSEQNFFKSIEKNLYLQDYEEELLMKLSTKNHLDTISLLARENNLNKDLNELESLKEIPEFIKHFEEEEKKIDDKIRIFTLLFSLDTSYNDYKVKFPKIINSYTEPKIKKMLDIDIKELEQKIKFFETNNIHHIYKSIYKLRIKRLKLKKLEEQFRLISKKNEQEKGEILKNKIIKNKFKKN